MAKKRKSAHPALHPLIREFRESNRRIAASRKDGPTQKELQSELKGLLLERDFLAKEAERLKERGDAKGLRATLVKYDKVQARIRGLAELLDPR